MATRTTKKTAAQATEVKETKASEAVETKPEAAETAAKKAAPKKTAKTTAEPKKETAAKEAAPAKEAAVKEAAPAKKAEAAHTEPEVSVVFECGGRQIVAKEVLAKAMDAFRTAHADVEIKELKLYVNAEDNCAYIVVNGQEYPEDKIDIM